VPAAESEIARARLLDAAPDGFEEIDHGDELELVAYTGARGETRIRAAFGAVTATDVAAGWEDRWREFHRPVEVAGLWVGPPWIAAPGAIPAVVIEPGQAFGTGAHATTRACIEALAGSARASVLDAGCGSGVLAIAAAKLGHAPVHAADADPAAVAAARENAERNEVEVHVMQADVLNDALPAADLLVANIELRAVETLLARWTGGRAIVSGYLAREAPAVAGWTRTERYELDGWAADSLARTV
jgi:ribosomal protein L11 methyltransferase